MQCAQYTCLEMAEVLGSTTYVMYAIGQQSRMKNPVKVSSLFLMLVSALGRIYRLMVRWIRLPNCNN